MVTIRRFVKGLYDKDWARLANVDLKEFRRSMQDPEFDSKGMYLAYIGKKTVGIADAHISPSCPSFCVLRDLQVDPDCWNSVAPLLLDAAVKSLFERGARSVETWSPYNSKRYILLLERRGFEKKSVDCKMKHGLKRLLWSKNPRIQFKTYSEILDAAMIANLQNSIFEGLIGRPVTKEEVMFWMKNLDFECFVGYYNGEPVASSFCEIKTAKAELQGWIYGLGVLPNYRRLKIGTALVYRVLDYVKSRGANSAFVETEYRGYEQRFYESTGFHVESRIVCLEKKLRKTC